MRRPPFSRGFKDEACVVQRSPFSHCVLGRTPAAGRRNPRRGFGIKRLLGFCVSRSGRGWFWAANSEPKRGFGLRNSHPLGGAASSRGGPAERSEKGDRCTTRTSSVICTPKPENGQRQSPPSGGCDVSRGDPAEAAGREGGALHNAHSPLCNGHGARCIARTSSLDHREKAPAAKHARLLMQRPRGALHNSLSTPGRLTRLGSRNSRRLR